MILLKILNINIIYQHNKLQKIKFKLINHKRKNRNQTEIYNISQEAFLKKLIRAKKQLKVGFNYLQEIEKFSDRFNGLVIIFVDNLVLIF